MSQTTLARKLRIAKGQEILILNPPLGYLEAIGALPEGATIATSPEGTYPFVQLFVVDTIGFQSDIEVAVHAVEYDGLFWLSYPKRSGSIDSDLSRENVRELMAPYSMRPVSQIAIDEVWTALRFRPSKEEE